MMDRPVPFIQEDENGKWFVCDEAGALLQKLDGFISAVALVGKYGTGKSFLLNVLHGSNDGFQVGSTLKTKTKGIWLFAQPHPKIKDTYLVFLDVEGFFYGTDIQRDMELFLFALLLSNCLIYNATTILDEILFQQLSLVTRLVNFLKKKGDKRQKEAQSKYFPALCVVLRDFFFDLEINGEKITADEYLEHALNPNQQTPHNTAAYNSTCENVKNSFPYRNCFTLPVPVKGEILLRQMGGSAKNLDPEFLVACEKLKDNILKRLNQMNTAKVVFTSQGYCEYAQGLVHAVNEHGIPHLQSIATIYEQTQLKEAYQDALRLYKQKMENSLQVQQRLKRETLHDLHNAVKSEAIQMFDLHTYHLTRLDNTLKSQNLEKEIDATFVAIKKRHSYLALSEAQSILRTSFAHVLQNMKRNRYATIGGYASYVNDVKHAEERYKRHKNLPLAVLQSYLNELSYGERIIKQTDENLQPKEKIVLDLRKKFITSRHTNEQTKSDIIICIKKLKRQKELQLYFHEKPRELIMEWLDDETVNDTKTQEMIERLQNEIDACRNHLKGMQEPDKDFKPTAVVQNLLNILIDVAKSSPQSMTWLGQTKGDCNMTLEERYKQFRQKANGKYPLPIQGHKLDKRLGRVNIYVTEGTERQTIYDFLKDYENILPLQMIHMVEEKPLVPLMNPKLRHENYLLAGAEAKPSLGPEERLFIGRGSSMYAFETKDADIFQDYESFLSQNLQILPVWSVGYMMVDRISKEHYLITTIHSLLKYSNAREIHGKHETESLSFFARYDQSNSETVSVRLSDHGLGYFGTYSGNYTSVGVDFLALPMHKRTIKRFPFNFDIICDNFPLFPEVYHGEIAELDGKRIFVKSQTNIEESAGIIKNIIPDRVITLYKEDFEDLIAVVMDPTSKVDSFAKIGASGSLGYLVDKENRKAILAGLVFVKLPEVECNGEMYKDVTFLVKLKNCLDAFRHSFGLELECLKTATPKNSDVEAEPEVGKEEIHGIPIDGEAKPSLSQSDTQQQAENLSKQTKSTSKYDLSPYLLKNSKHSSAEQSHSDSETDKMSSTLHRNGIVPPFFNTV